MNNKEKKTMKSFVLIIFISFERHICSIHLAFICSPSVLTVPREMGAKAGKIELVTVKRRKVCSMFENSLFQFCKCAPLLLLTDEKQSSEYSCTCRISVIYFLIVIAT